MIKEISVIKNESDLEIFVNKYYSRLCVYSVQYTDCLETSEDIVQEFFIDFWNEKKYLSITRDLKSYVFSSIRNASIDYIRKKSSLIFTDLEEDSYID